MGKRKLSTPTNEDIVQKRQRANADTGDEVNLPSSSSDVDFTPVNRRLFQDDALEADTAKTITDASHSLPSTPPSASQRDGSGNNGDIALGTDGADEAETNFMLGGSKPSVVTIDGVDLDMLEFDKTMQSRILSMRSYADRNRAVYYVTKFPLDLRFGSNLGINMANFLVRQDNSAALIWVVGRIVVTHFMDEDGGWADQVYLSVMPLCRDDTKAATRILNSYSKPKLEQEMNPFGTILAGRFQKAYQSPKPATEFKASYDAREGMKSKRELAPYPCAKLKKGDLILMESRIRKRLDSRDGNENVKKDDQPYRAAFHLNAVYLLREGRDEEEESVSYNF